MQLLRVLFIFLLLSSSQFAVAKDRPYYSLDEMAARIQQQSGAQILSAEAQQTEKGEVYRFKVKKNGRVRVMLLRPDGSAVKKKRK
jgi:hypothetical protein